MSWRIQIQQDPLTMSLSLYVAHVSEMATAELYECDLRVRIVPVSEIQGQPMKPMLSIPVLHDPEGFYRALVQALVDGGYTKWESEELKGEMRAMELHLNDMRRIVEKRLELNFDD